MNSKYLWHVLLTPQDDEPEIFENSEDAADYLNEMWERGHNQAHMIPCINVQTDDV